MKLDLAAQRFRADLGRVLPEGLRPGEPLGLAVSGGPDSMAMLLLARAALPGQVAAATVDHGLRAGAAGEAALVATACAGLGIPHATLRPDEPIRGGNLQSRARAARYALLGRWAVSVGARVLATAHHTDDQAETFLMRASRGSGLAGLAAVRPRRAMEVTRPTGQPVVFDAFDLSIVRPLLGWRRAELAAVVAAVGYAVVTDPSNDDDRFDRTRMRRLLVEQPALDPLGLAQSASHAAEADADLRAIRRWLWTERQRPSDTHETLLDIAELPRTLQRMLCRMAVEDVRKVNGITRPTFGEATNIEALLDALNAGRAANQAGVLGSVERGLWRFRHEPPRRGK